MTIENCDVSGSVFEDAKATMAHPSSTTRSTCTDAFHNHVTVASQLRVKVSTTISLPALLVYWMKWVSECPWGQLFTECLQGADNR